MFKIFFIVHPTTIIVWKNNFYYSIKPITESKLFLKHNNIYIYKYLPDRAKEENYIMNFVNDAQILFDYLNYNFKFPSIKNTDIIHVALDDTYLLSNVKTYKTSNIYMFLEPGTENKRLRIWSPYGNYKLELALLIDTIIWYASYSSSNVNLINVGDANYDLIDLKHLTVLELMCF